LLLDSETTDAVCANVPRTTTPWPLDPPGTGESRTRFDRNPCGAPTGVTVSVAVRVVPLYDAVIVTVVFAETADVLIVNVPVKLNGAAVTVAGTLATAGWLLVNPITAPSWGALVLSTTVPLDWLPPSTVDGLVEKVDKVGGGGAASGVKVRTADHGPGTPSMLKARTRQKCGVAARPLATALLAVMFAMSRTIGAVNVLESSICSV
jgi:hypothetical protein